MKKINDGLTTSQRYRLKNLEKCREAGRKCQLKLNDNKRFGGLRLPALKRDKYICQICGKNVSGKNMSVMHHLDGNKDNNILSNLTTLCKSCHPRLHYNLGEYQFTPKKMKQLWKKHGIKFFNR